MSLEIQFLGVPTVVQGDWQSCCSTRTQVRSLAGYSGLKIWSCCLRLWLWSDFWPRNSIWYGAAQKEKNQFLGPWSLYFDPWSKERHKSLVRDCGGWGGLTTHTCPECPGSIISQAFTVMTKHNHCCHNEESIKHSYGPPSHSSLALKIIPLFKLLN